MPLFVKRVLLPGLGCLLVAVLMDALFAWNGWPSDLRLGHTLVPVNWMWLLSLPLCGAVGADLAQRAGATVKGRIIAAALPSLTMAGLFVLMAVVEIPMRALTGYLTAINSYAVDAVTGFAIWQVLVPGVMLITGSLPFVIQKNTPGLQPEAR